MNPEIERLSCKKLVGNRMIMTFSDNKTYELWMVLCRGGKKSLIT